MINKLSKDGYVMGIDFGTSNLKGALYDLNGNEVAFESVEYNLFTPSQGIVENDVNNYWKILKGIFKKLIEKIDGNAERILAIGTASQGETIVPIDKNGNPLRNAIVWIDSRSAAEAEEIRQNFNNFEMYKITGQPDADTSWPASRIRWIKKHEPDIFKKTYKFLLLEDYIVYKLTGGFFGEAGVYNSSYYYDVVNFKFIDEMLDFLEITPSKLPQVNKPGTCVGNISKKCSQETGLSTNTKVVMGEMDQICGAVGAGNVENGIATETTGSAFAMVVTTGAPMINSEYKLPFQIHAIPGSYALMPFSMTGGMVLKWFKDTFCQYEELIAKEKNINVYGILDELASDAPAGCEGLIMLPHLCGAFFPEYNTNAKGVYFGISINHSKGYFIRSILESLAYMMKQNLNYINKMGIDIKRLISIGGGAKSKLWCQIKADVCNINLEVPNYTETALLGAALIAACGTGIFKDIKTAGKNLIKLRETFTPNKNNVDKYNINFKKYVDLYKNTEKLF
ncbi:MAG: FGGY family carbohydrate kinase [Actinomycetota bacterium]|nr:FGGY family carbohydrate kinase [Actinomycetota bacterium]